MTLIVMLTMTLIVMSHPWWHCWRTGEGGFCWHFTAASSWGRMLPSGEKAFFTLKRITETRYFSVFRKVVNISGKNIGLTQPNYFDLVCLIFHLFQTFEEALRSRICMASWCARLLWGKKIIPIKVFVPNSSSWSKSLSSSSTPCLPLFL